MGYGKRPSFQCRCVFGRVHWSVSLSALLLASLLSWVICNYISGWGCCCLLNVSVCLFVDMPMICYMPAILPTHLAAFSLVVYLHPGSILPASACWSMGSSDHVSESWLLLAACCHHLPFIYGMLATFLVVWTLFTGRLLKSFRQPCDLPTALCYTCAICCHSCPNMSCHVGACMSAGVSCGVTTYLVGCVLFCQCSYGMWYHGSLEFHPGGTYSSIVSLLVLHLQGHH